MYHHTQSGSLMRLLLVILLVVFLYIIWLGYRHGGLPGIRQEEAVVVFIMLGFSVLLIIAVLLLFHNLTVFTDESSMRLKFGIGLIGKRIPFDQIESCQPVKNSWWWGWGIRRIPGGGRLYNISGLDAVELKMKKGSLIRIGTDEPELLSAVINERLGTAG